MKKKIFATLLVGAVVAVSVFGFTACGNDGGGGATTEINKGEQVTAEQWGTAFANTKAAKNVSVGEYYKRVNETYGTYELNGESIEGTTTTEVESFCNRYYDYAAYYSKRNTKDSETYFPETEDARPKYGDYDSEYYLLVDNGVCKAVGYEEVYGPGSWYANYEDYYSGPMLSGFFGNYSIIKGDNKVELSTLYEAFEYSDGVYTAKLWTNAYDGSRYVETETTVCVSIKKGYVIGYSEEWIDEVHGLDQGIFGCTGHKRTFKGVCNMYDYAVTAVKPSPAAQDAMQKFYAQP